MTLRGKMLLYHHFWEPTIHGRRVEDFRYQRRQEMEEDESLEDEWPDDTRWQS